MKGYFAHFFCVNCIQTGAKRGRKRAPAEPRRRSQTFQKEGRCNVKNDTIILGYVPVRRDMFPDKPAVMMNEKIRARVKAICETLGDIELVDIADVVDGGLLWCKDDVEPVIEYLRSKKVDAVFFPHCNFGQEEAVAKVARAVGKPVLLWGPRDPAPQGEDEFRVFDTQCGLFATSKVLSRYGVPFTYLENCWLEDETLDKGIDKFIRVASVIKAVRSMRIGVIGPRPRQFLSVEVNESELVEKFGIELTTIWTEEVSTVVQKLQKGMGDAIGSRLGVELPIAVHNWKEDGEPDPRIAQRVKEFKDTLDCSRMDDSKLEIMAAVEIAIEELARINHLDAVAVDCWAYLSSKYGIQACFILGDLIDRGLIAACETDVHAAITARMLQAAARGRSAPFIADLTCRHPTNDNAELLWHCGPFAKSLRKEGVQGSIRSGKGYYEIKGGDITVARFDQLGGNYLLFADQVVGCEGPVTNGNYVWVETNNWPEWEKKLMYGPYIHHLVGVHGCYADVMKESCKYITNLTHDSVNAVASL